MFTSLGQVLPRSEAQFRNKIAVTVGRRCLSYTDLNKTSNRLANALVALGVHPGDRVTLYSANGWEWVVSYYAVLKAGGIVNPINGLLTPREVNYIVNDCGARVIITSQERAEQLSEFRKEMPVQHIVAYGDTPIVGAHAFEGIIQAASEQFELVDRNPDDISTIGYTSGTTGHPKGAMLTHHAVILNSLMTANMHVRTAADRVVTALPCAHVYGNIVMNGSLMTGSTLVLMPRFDAEEAIKLIVSRRATIFDGVPTMYMYMLGVSGVENFDFSELTRCTVGGQTMPIATMQSVEERFSCPLLELWGMTEIAGCGATHPFYAGSKLGSTGISLPRIACRIADADNAIRTLPLGEVGELLVRGPVVMKGYYGNDSATREAIEPDGWLHTGDLARMDEDGYIYIVDRKSDMIITAGYNIYPAEVERVVAKHPAVSMVAVTGVPNAIKGEIAKAFIVLKPGFRPSAEEIISHCREELAAYKIPRAIAFVADLPKTSTGKIVRRKLRNLDSDSDEFL
jgi:long-chain acyl-CoA synthetase